MIEFAFALGSAPVILFIAMGIISGVPAALLIVLPAEMISAENKDVGFGIFYTLFYVGLACLIPIGGYSRDLFDTPAAAVAAGAFLCAIVPIIAIGCYFSLLRGRGI
jgi:hypothetical protein